ncbi:MAG: HD domain-containing protein [Candidatus Omnitrophica bacterium]|nr:HD domain-containing protein [Candidatus Omnitrophota bacterium]
MDGNNSILLIQEDQAFACYLRDELVTKGGYTVSVEYSAHAGLEAFKNNRFAMVITEFSMSDLRGAELIRELKNLDPDCVIIIFINELNQNIFKEVSILGVYDFVSKPVDLEKLFLLIKKGMELHLLMVAHRKFILSLKEQNASLQRQNALLAKRYEEATKNLVRLYEEVHATYMRTIKVLAQAIETRDHYTHSHSENVAKYAVAIAEQMQLSFRDIETLREACELHDLGKLGIQDSILMKPSMLNEEEWMEIKQHPDSAVKILEPLTFLNKDVTELIRQHHEHYDGTGYPEGRRAEEIRLGARIIHLADAYDAMRSARSYRKVPLSKEEAILEIKKKSGTQFDPKVVEAFLKIADKLEP